MTPVLERIYRELERAGVSEDRISDIRSRAQNCDASPEAEQRRAKLCAAWCVGSVIPAVMELLRSPLADIWLIGGLDKSFDAFDDIADIVKMASCAQMVVMDSRFEASATDAVANAMYLAKHARRVLGDECVDLALCDLFRECL